MTSWTTPRPGGGEPPAARGPLTASPLDPLPPRMVPPPPPPIGRTLPLTARVLVAVVLVLGNPWAYPVLFEWVSDLPDSEGLAGLVTGLGEMTVFALRWPHWDPRIAEPRMLGYALAQNLRTLLFVLVTVWLLRRLATGAPPRRAYRVLAVFAAPLVGAAVAAVGVTALLVMVDNLHVYGYRDDPSRVVRDMLAGGLHAGFVLGGLLAWVQARWPDPVGTDVSAIDRR
ncbi:hypothetical protein [Micromonospora sp. KC213]|uniref:hypothetical protein n=1 Tax=Micromonospora sp. KC213 TaxID=2530378 RepID=UPI0010461869|nr:hypothetical protein [Micromonospora sp. KC213]TDC42023.1 hypothetical protein E1166_09260 [Micromonospora sp. KC213]